MRGAEVAHLLAAAAVFNLADSNHQHMILEGVAELTRIALDATGKDTWQATDKSAWLLGALLEGVHLATIQGLGDRYEVTDAVAANGSRPGTAPEPAPGKATAEAWLRRRLDDLDASAGSAP
jgi:hypothetical protein